MSNDTIGLISGGGQLPLLLARAARASGKRVVAVGIKNEVNSQLAQEVDEYTVINLGQLGRLIKSLRSAGVERAIMAGSIGKTKLFKDFLPDLKAINEFRKMRHRGDNSLLTGLAEVLGREGITITAAHELVPELLAPEGLYTAGKPNERQWDDIALGWEVADRVGRLDIGQCVVVSHGVVTAVEAIEGTDKTIERGGRLGAGDAVVIKRCKPNQDLRFDLPAIGPDTIEAMASTGCTALAVEAGRSMVFDRPELVERADKYGISVLGLTESQAAGGKSA